LVQKQTVIINLVAVFFCLRFAVAENVVTTGLNSHNLSAYGVKCSDDR